SPRLCCSASRCSLSVHDPAPTEIYTLSLHDALPISNLPPQYGDQEASLLLPSGYLGPAFLTLANYRAILKYNNSSSYGMAIGLRSEEHTSELQSRENLVCRLLLEKKNIKRTQRHQET